jgi:hypothetical protein
MKWVTALLFLYNTILGYVVVNATIESYKLIVLGVISIDCMLLFYFIAYIYDLGSRRIMRLAKHGGKGVYTGASLGIMKVKVNLLIGIIFLYNMLLGLILAELTTNPFIVMAFVCVDFFFIFYYVWLITVERLREHKFKVEHADLIKHALLEIQAGRT